jgi:hypothetical protein
MNHLFYVIFCLFASFTVALPWYTEDAEETTKSFEDDHRVLEYEAQQDNISNQMKKACDGVFEQMHELCERYKFLANPEERRRSGYRGNPLNAKYFSPVRFSPQVTRPVSRPQYRQGSRTIN